MSTSAELAIDPSLRDQSVPETSKVGGTKRKTRVSQSNAASSPSTSTGRTTRRSAGVAASQDVGGKVTGEPARGEEENLNGYWGPSNPVRLPSSLVKYPAPPSSEADLLESALQKRPRRSSPTKRSKPSTTIPNPGFIHDAQTTGNVGGPSGSADDARGLSLAGIEDLAAAAIAANVKASGIFPYFPMYPVGVTPFRYPCLTPSIPNPQPGDPHNPKFRPFNPHAPAPASTAKGTVPSQSTSSSHTSGSTTQNQGQAGIPEAREQQEKNLNIDPQLTELSRSSQIPPQTPQQSQSSGMPQGVNHSAAEQIPQQASTSLMDHDTAASADAAFESISALLSASQGVYPTLDSIDYGQTQ
uniref:Uncharacterized protein n=1 Tax=Kwoniella dejecticola CBS 10117 TaxID=1296121 RepID=A0A1A6AGD3_9TREE|nr:uncharacterized protein I303_00910 [Kwoniella dejecticola CBS 10117]OBR89088.1 hypothetical protein I303_00910 [Kwoniella dejecticola CBS 10117]